MFLNLLCVSLLLFIDGVAPVNGMRCYNCNSKTQRACDDNFKLTSLNTSYIVDNCDYCNKYHFKDTDVYVRNCTAKISTGFQYKSGCEKQMYAGEKVEACACGNEDLCNGARSEFAALVIILFICFSVYSLYHLFAFDLHLN